jgi:hypothetical protein
MVDPLLEAIGPFVQFLGIIEAMDENGEFTSPITEHTVIAHLMFGGGSITLHVADLRRLAAIANAEALPLYEPVECPNVDYQYDEEHPANCQFCGGSKVLYRRNSISQSSPVTGNPLQKDPYVGDTLFQEMNTFRITLIDRSFCGVRSPRESAALEALQSLCEEWIYPIDVPEVTGNLSEEAKAEGGEIPVSEDSATKEAL